MAKTWGALEGTEPEAAGAGALPGRSVLGAIVLGLDQHWALEGDGAHTGERELTEPVQQSGEERVDV